MCKIITLLFLGGLSISSGLFFVLNSEKSVLFQSLESVTEKGAPVFNQVRLLRKPNQDIWIMRQSHEGVHKDLMSWDRLAIVVDTSKTPKEAKFYQFTKGELEL